jgi:hypothetical protein
MHEHTPIHHPLAVTRHHVCSESPETHNVPTDGPNHPTPESSLFARYPSNGVIADESSKGWCDSKMTDCRSRCRMGTGMHRNLGDKGHFLGERRAIFLDQARSCIWDHRHAEYRHHQSTLLYTINNTQLHTIYVTRSTGCL